MTAATPTTEARLMSDETRVDVLKPCPFCGESHTVIDELTVAVVCTNCNAYGPSSMDEDEAMENWNRRAGATP